MVFVQKWPFFQLFFFQAISTSKMSFSDILERKNAFLGYKNNKFKKSKIDIFPQWLTHGFGPKKAIFSNYFFVGNISQENVFYDIVERKNAFIGYKNKNFKKSKNSHFPKRVNPWFCSKMAIFFNFFFVGNISQENVFQDFVERKNAFLAYKIKKKFKKSKN